MISLVQPLPSGNALRVFLTPPNGAAFVRLLRRSNDQFSGPDDTGAFLVADDTVDHVVLDTTGLINGQTYFYKAYAKVGAAWQESSIESGIPAATYQDHSTAVVEFVRERLAAGLAIEVQRNTIKHELNKIPVLIASPTFEDTKWPVVTIHVAADSSDQRFLGEVFDSDWQDPEAGNWVGNEGWLSGVQLAITGWALNADVRAALRKAIKRIILANLPVFEGAGIYQVAITQRDMDDFQSYSAPVFQSIAQFSCLARSSVTSVDDAIIDVVVNPPVVPAAFNP